MLPLLAAGLLAAAPAPEAPDQKRLEAEISKEMGASPSPAAPSTPSAAAPADAPESGAPAKGESPYSRLVFIPNIAAIGDFALAYTTLDPAQLEPVAPPVPWQAHRVTPLFQEVELALQLAVDPYARADVFLAFGPDGVEVEEAYLTTLSLPWGLQLKAGKYLSPFGRINQQHRHQWEFVDAPLSFQRLLGLEGLNGAGADVSWLAPLPWFLELHLDYQATQPLGAAGQELTGIARLLQVFPLSDAVTLALGLSWGGVEETAGGWRLLGGVDAYLRIRPPAGRAYLALQGELFTRRFNGTSQDGTAVGGYAQAVWRMSPYWLAGVRYDNAPSGFAWPTGHENHVALLGGFMPSEFWRVRMQLGAGFYPGGAAGYDAQLTLEFSIGSHGAHPF